LRINDEACNRFKRSKGTAWWEESELEFLTADLFSLHEFKTISIYKKNLTVHNCGKWTNTITG
jgi:hypothetical protein